MSQYGSNCQTLKEMLKKYPGKELAVIDTFHGMITNECWNSEEIVDFLSSGKGISPEADKILEDFIQLEKSFDN